VFIPILYGEKHPNLYGRISALEDIICPTSVNSNKKLQEMKYGT
jgi:hypothetical protein